MPSLKALSELALALQQPLTFEETLQLIVARTAAILGTESTSLRLLDASRARLLAVCRHGRPVHEGRGEEFRVGEGLMGWIAEHAQPIVASDAQADARFAARSGMQMRFRSFLGVPLMEGSSCIGVLGAVHADIGFFTEVHLQQASLVAAICAPRVESARLKRLARIDPLTGALNRRGFESQFPESAAREGEFPPISIVMVDIDHFKKVNDTHGHHVGDDVLRAVTNILASVLRETDAIVRYGGEEFVLALPHANARGAERVAERARAVLANSHVRTGDGKIAVTASFGVAQRRPGETREALLQRADAALYRAKSSGRNRVEMAD